ncbi:hypothetical protein TREMEDRAFT_71746 [Tremella mesenterica DSM 1558]|uniref:uncharacterized protein n=1 Tax=Tremella mesenterica (strain ATCC 24925 / CBS 8224 / DSM 1558 / NBRC 9311 / NRRL Y-6157 / RJB 2259-6 / UBC 559-6) TaxID=578456 RepID=UPI0003F49B9C|nr:uncharacterized protein TREMEDRAFT_71746 [Tremella mesenterica DSM 1558]EIW68983.1 hypothetical protein TREMEDRAFT_71746 [Tremella mesenterica DSM 1558]
MQPSSPTISRTSSVNSGISKFQDLIGKSPSRPILTISQASGKSDLPSSPDELLQRLYRFDSNGPPFPPSDTLSSQGEAYLDHSMITFERDYESYLNLPSSNAQNHSTFERYDCTFCGYLSATPKCPKCPSTSES